jgi:CubicO group peptidase (beta-lactamase class C family)
MPDGSELMITDANQPFGNFGVKEMFSFLKHFKQTRQPGVKYEYSNFAVGLLGVLIEKIYHKPYPELIRTYITMSLKMNETMAFVDALKFKNVAQGYNGLFEPVPFFNLTAIRSAGIIKSSTADLITYAKAQLLTPDAALSAAIKLTHQITFNSQGLMVGLGWHYLPDDKNVLQHGGATGGCRASVCIDLSKQIGVVILTNNAGTGDMVGRNLIKAIQAIKVTPAYVPLVFRR